MSSSFLVSMKLQAINNISPALREILRDWKNVKSSLKNFSTPNFNNVKNPFGGISESAKIAMKATEDMQRTMGSAYQNAKMYAGIGLGVAAAGVGISAKKGIDYEAQLSSIKALTGSTQAEMAEINRLSLQLGASTKYSALQVAQGAEEMLKAGLSLEQLKSGSLEAGLNLATAGGLDLKEASEIMSTSLNTFNKDGIKAVDASNLLAGAANASATSVHELKYALSSVGVISAGVGFSLKDTSTALAVMAQNGLKSSDAGTSLKTLLGNLQPSTKKATALFKELGLITKNNNNIFYDAKGHIKSMAEVAEILKNKLGGMTPQKQSDYLKELFGTDAWRAGTILTKEGAAGIKKMYSEMSKVTALDVAKEKMNNAAGAIEQLKGAMETMEISFMMPILPTVKDVALVMANLSEKYMPAVESKGERIGETMKEIFAPFTATIEKPPTSQADFKRAEYDPSILTPKPSQADFKRAEYDPEYAKKLKQQAENAKFSKMSFEEKVTYSLDKATASMDAWLSGPGGQKAQIVFTKLAEIGVKSWLTVLKGLGKASWDALMSGNFAGAGGAALLAGILGGGFLLKTGWSIGKAGWDIGKGAYDLFKGKKDESEHGGKSAKKSIGTNLMTVRAARVYINGPISQMGGKGKGRSPSILGPDGKPLTKEGKTFKKSKPNIPEKPKTFKEKVTDVFKRKPKPPTTGLEEMGRMAKLARFAKGAGIVGTVAGVGLVGYEMYQQAKQTGLRQAISARGGSLAGGAVGGLIGGAVGSFGGPLGTMAGAAFGNLAGTKLGSMMDTKGWTKSIVDGFIAAKDKLKGWWNGEETKKAGTDVKQMSTTTKQHTTVVKQQMTQLTSTAGQSANQTKSSLGSISSVTNQGKTWGTTLMSGLIASITAQFPGLRSAVAQLQSIMNVSIPRIQMPISGIVAYAKDKGNLPPSNPLIGLTFHANGGVAGIVNKPTLVGGGTGVAGEVPGEAEMVIPLARHRRKRAMELLGWTNNYFGLNKFANGGITGSYGTRQSVKRMFNKNTELIRKSGGTKVIQVVPAGKQQVEVHVHVHGTTDSELERKITSAVRDAISRPDKYIASRGRHKSSWEPAIDY